MSKLWLVRDRSSADDHDDPTHYLVRASSSAEAHRAVLDLRRAQLQAYLDEHPGVSNAAQTYFGSADPDGDVQVPIELTEDVYIVSNVLNGKYELVGEDQS